MARIALVTGGSTPERTVALAGAAEVVATLRAGRHEVAVVDTATGLLSRADEERLLLPDIGTAPPSPGELAALAARELGPGLVAIPEVRAADLVFLVLHGRQGESGEIQALLEMAGLPYTGSGPLGSALAMDKEVAKRLFRQAGIPTADWAAWPAGEAEVAALGMPLVVKPVKAGSSVGMSIIDTPEELDAAVETARAVDDEVVLERYVPGREVSVGVLAGEALAVGEIIPRHRFFDYECKYTPGMTREVFPAELPLELAEEVRRLGLAAHRALKLRDFSRVDFRLDAAGRPLCLEANTLPGMTRASLLPQSAAAAGIGFGDLCQRICDLAASRSDAPATVAGG